MIGYLTYFFYDREDEYNSKGGTWRLKITPEDTVSITHVLASHFRSEINV